MPGVTPDPAAGEPSRRLFFYNGGFLRERRLRQVLRAAGWSLHLGLPGPEDRVVVWGRSRYAGRGEAVAARRGVGLVRLEDTFLRSVRTTVQTARREPRVIGIDDWAWRKGQRYGTLICDLERRRVVDLLPDREPATVEAWLRARPGIEVVARDRNGGYGDAVARALPHAVQVADRWHLLECAGDRGASGAA